MAGQGLEAIVIFDGGIAAMARFNIIGDVPKKLAIAAHTRL
jgi:hypothetical protein